MAKTSKASSVKKATPTTSAKKAAPATNAKKAAPTTSAKRTTTKTSYSKSTSSRTNTSKMRNSSKTRTQSSVENGIKILQMAIKGKLSLSEASRRNSFGRNYFSDVKARIKENYKNKKIDRETYQNFSSLLKTYNSL